GPAGHPGGHQPDPLGRGQLLPARRGQTDAALPHLVLLVAGHAVDPGEAPQGDWTWLRKRYFGKDKISQAGVTLFRPDSVPVTRYRYRGSKIPTPWDAATAPC